MDEQVLKEKLAKWAGLDILHIFSSCGVDGIVVCERCGATKPALNKYCSIPDFTHSLDACFKWLVPPAIDRIMAEQECSSDIAYAILFKKWLQELELIIPKAALALCLAIKKLIDMK